MSNDKSFHRLFTVNEANSLLTVLRPLIEEISENLDILKKYSTIVIHEKGLDPTNPDLVDKLKENESIIHALGRLKDLVHEINRFGCVSKGIEQGLVDFPCQFGDEIVFLCWRYGETSVGHWHPINDGFAGRKPLLEASGMAGGSLH